MKFNFFKRSTLPKIRLNPTFRSQPRPWKKYVKWGALGLGILIVFILIVSAVYYPRLKKTYADAKQAQTYLTKIGQQVNQQNFVDARKNLDSLRQRLILIKQDMDKMAGLKMWPYVGRQYRAAYDLLQVGDKSSNAADAMLDFLAHLLEPFSGQGKISLASITPAEKGILLSGIASREDSLKTAQVAIHEAAQALEKIPAQGLIGPLQKVITPIKQQFPLLIQAMDQAIPASHVLPAILGYPEAKTYLFLLQNNTELRPAGGFIGTYGLMKVSSGEIVSLATDNSYNLDEAAKNLPVIAPPEPLQKYLKANVWYFRDSNWSPDFPTAAQQALMFYQREGGSKNVDGVLAVTPTTISELLRLVGSITIGKTEFTADNFTDKLQYYVDEGFKYAGQAEADRKDIIGLLTKELMDRIMKLPVTDWKNLFLVLSDQLNEKQVLLYMKDSSVQNILISQNWAGALSRGEQTDQLMIVDANLASLKTDAVMKRNYKYEVTLDGDRPTVTLTINYNNTGKFDWKTTRYNTYVRVYVPAGAELISSAGAQLREKSNAAGVVSTSTELGRTVFGAYKSIEPGTNSDLILTYSLPAGLGFTDINKYTLSWQKQSGLLPVTIQLYVKYQNHRASDYSGLDNLAKIGQSTVSFDGSLAKDRDIIINY